jgi:membrane protein
LKLVTRAKESRPVRVVKAYGEAHAGDYAAGLAFRAFLSMFPIILGLLVVVGLVVRDAGMRASVESAVTSVFPSDAGSQVRQALDGVSRAAGPLGIVSLLGLLWTGTSFFGNLEFALTQMFGTRQRDTLRQRAMGGVMLVFFLLAVVVAVGANSTAASTPLGVVAGLVVGTLVLVGLIAAIYRFVPNRTFSLRQVLPGAVVAGVAIELFTLLFPLYAKVMHGFNTYGQQFALFFLMATWLLFLSHFILLGAVVVRMQHGAPSDEGLVSAPEGDSRDVERPAEAVEEQRSLQGRPAQPTRSTAP